MTPTPPPLPAPSSQWTPLQVRSHLQNLNILFYVLAIVHVLAGGLFVLISVAGYVSERGSTSPDAAPVGLFIVLLALSVLGAILGVVQFFTARYIGRRIRLRYCTIASFLACFAGPLGMALCAYAYVAFKRPEVRAAFDEGNALPA